MRLLHTSDWHIGRTFHGNPTVANLRTVLEALIDIVTDKKVDVVVVPGDIFDSATPAAEYIELLTDTLHAIRNAGSAVVMTSGNHDSATRLGFQSGFAGLAGIHIITRPEQHDQPVALTDEHGTVNFYGIPYLEPAMIRHRYPDEPLRNHADVLALMMSDIRADLARRGGRSVVLSHAFIVNVPASDVERDITAGGLDYVPLGTFDGPDYVALGHIHGRATLSDRVRYSGAPLHYSFSEADKPRGVWIVDLDAAGLAEVEWVDLPVPRALSVLTGDIETLLTDAAYREFEGDWVSAILTDTVRPMDPMRRLRTRFEHAAHLEHRPVAHAANAATYSERVRGQSDSQIIDGFLEHVRNGVVASVAEKALIASAIAQVTA
jgi:DNA repair protein SbcD/Mre11